MDKHNEEETMKKYGISSEEKEIYIYKGYRYDKLEDAVNYAISEEKNNETVKKIEDSKMLSGRIRRGKFAFTIVIGWVLILLIIMIVGGVLSDHLSNNVADPLGIILMLPVTLWVWRSTWLRFHDIGKSGWYLLGMFVPLLNLFLFVILLFRKGDEGENAYGPAPQ